MVSLHWKDRSGMIDDLKTAYINDIFVRKEYRRKGIGKIIFEQLEIKAKEHDAKRVDLMVLGFNETAFELYKSLGMKPQRYIA